MRRRHWDMVMPSTRTIEANQRSHTVTLGDAHLPTRGHPQSRPTPSSSAEATGAATSAVQDAAFFLRQSAPDPGVLARLYGPSQTGLSDLAAMAHGLRLFDLAKRWTGNPGREE